MTYGRVPFDVGDYEQRVQADTRAGNCFICAIVDGERHDHLVLFRDDLCIEFLDKYPTLLGYSLLAPLEHRTDVIGSFDTAEYVELQQRVHRLGRAVSACVPTERLYVMSLGSQQGNAHVHWHVAPLPPGVPYQQQQFAALTRDNGCLDVPNDHLVSLARHIRLELVRTET
jgi:ATP adenylyltransferase